VDHADDPCDYPVLAVAKDQSALLSLGDYCLAFDWGIPEEAFLKKRSRGWLRILH
jgi:hypothetical protein